MNFRLLIVEDEPLERELLEGLIRTGYPRISEIYTADNGIEALELAQLKEPDIILLDINIPGITGIDIMKELSENRFSGEIVITTAFDSFTYAKEAVKYGAVGYMLKPIIDNELAEYLGKCFSIIEEKQQTSDICQRFKMFRSYAQDFLVRDIMKGNVPVQALKNAYGWPEDEMLQVQLMNIKFPCAIDQDLQRNIYKITEEIFQPFCKTLQTVNETELICFFQPQEQVRPDELKIYTWSAASSVVASVHEQAPSLLIGMQLLFSDVCRSYDKIFQSISNTAPLQIHVNTGTESGYSCRMKIAKSVQKMREGNAKRAVNVFRLLLECDATFWGGVQLLLKAVSEYNNKIDIMDGFLAADPKKPVEGLTKWVQEVLGRNESTSSCVCLDGALMRSDSTDVQPVIREALQIIEKEYGSLEISQTTLAERFGLNPAYFSRKFKKETGENFSTHMTKVRMKHAKERLDKGIVPDIVAQECGYTSRKYFYDTFRMFYGESVVHYLFGKEAENEKQK